jgi:hypothetical protein
VKRAVRVGALVVAGFVVLALALDGLGGLVQPALNPGGAEGVLRTTDEAGVSHETRLAVFEDAGGALWIQSGHHFRGWYSRLKRNPEVELVREDVVSAYHAVPLDTPEARQHIRALIVERVGLLGFYAIRTFLLFAEIKPVRLDPRVDTPPLRDRGPGT